MYKREIAPCYDWKLETIEVQAWSKGNSTIPALHQQLVAAANSMVQVQQQVQPLIAEYVAVICDPWWSQPLDDIQPWPFCSTIGPWTWTPPKQWNGGKILSINPHFQLSAGLELVLTEQQQHNRAAEPTKRCWIVPNRTAAVTIGKSAYRLRIHHPVTKQKL